MDISQFMNEFGLPMTGIVAFFFVIAFIRALWYVWEGFNVFRKRHWL